MTFGEMVSAVKEARSSRMLEEDHDSDEVIETIAEVELDIL